MIGKLAKVIGYPEAVPDGATIFIFNVDGGECIAEMIGSRLILKRKLDIEDEDLPRFAEFAAGRMLREEAVFSWDDHDECAILWQEIPSNADANSMELAFADFADSCDWWLQRVGEIHAPPSVFPDIMIRP